MEIEIEKGLDMILGHFDHCESMWPRNISTRATVGKLDFYFTTT